MTRVKAGVVITPGVRGARFWKGGHWSWGTQLPIADPAVSWQGQGGVGGSDRGGQPSKCRLGAASVWLGQGDTREPRASRAKAMLRVLAWTARRSNQPILKKISPEYSLERLMLKLNLQYFGHLMQRTDSFEKTLMPGKEEKGTTEDEMVGWHHRLNGHEFEQALGVGDGQGSLACCNPWGRKELDTTERLN